MPLLHEISHGQPETAEFAAIEITRRMCDIAILLRAS